MPIRLRDYICVTMLNFIKIGRSVAEIWRFFYFQDGGVRHLGFLKLRFKMFSGIRSANAGHHVKFRENRPNGCGDIAIFRFFKMAAAAILDFQKFIFLTASTFERPNLRYCGKHHQDRKIRCRHMANFQCFSRWRLSAMFDF